MAHSLSRSDPPVSLAGLTKNAPPPVLQLDSPIAVITGVQFVWPHGCRHCHVPAGLFTDGGRIEAGLALLPVRGFGPLVMQWSTRYLPAAAPQVPPMCPQPQCRHRRVRKLPSGPLVPYAWLENAETITAEPILVERSRPADRPRPVQVQITGMLTQIRSHVRRAEPRLALQADELSAVWRSADQRRR